MEGRLREVISERYHDCYMEAYDHDLRSNKPEILNEFEINYIQGKRLSKTPNTLEIRNIANSIFYKANEISMKHYNKKNTCPKMLTRAIFCDILSILFLSGEWLQFTGLEMEYEKMARIEKDILDDIQLHIEIPANWTALYDIIDNYVEKNQNIHKDFKWINRLLFKIK